MKIKIEIDETLKETEVVIRTEKVTDKVNNIVKSISDEMIPNIIMGFREDNVEILDETKILRIYSSSGKVFADTEDGEYILRLRLYQLEDRLSPSMFVRISNSEIINLKKVKKFDLSFVGTICVVFSNGVTTYVSRRYVSKIKKVLGI